MIRTSHLRASTLATLATYTYLKTPRSTENLESAFHGTTSDRMPNVQVGQVIKVKNHLFFTEGSGSADSYAEGRGFSAFRTGCSNEGSPLVLRVSPIPSSNSCWKRGVFGFHKYFPDGTLLKVEEVRRIPKLSAIEKELIYQSRHC